MRLIKRNGVYYCRFYTGKGMSEISTHQTERMAAAKVAEEAGLAKLELLARADVVNQQAVNMLLRRKKNFNMESLVIEYKEWGNSVRLSPSTIQSRVDTICHFIRFSDSGKKQPEEITISDINNFVNRQGEIRASSRKLGLENLRLFWGWLRDNSYATKNIAKLTKVDLGALSHEQKEKLPKEPMTDSEIACLLNQCQLRGEEFWAAAIQISRITGMRLSDVCRLEKASVSDRLVVFTKKSDARIALEIKNELFSILNKIEGDEKYYFPVERRQYDDGDSRSNLSMQFRRLCDRCEITGKSFHNIRHARATEIFNESGIEKVKENLGHRSESTSRIYVHEKSAL